MEVDSAHHFTVEGGLVVHNCWDAVRYALAPLIRSRFVDPAAFAVPTKK